MFCHSYRQQPLPWKCFLPCSELNHELNGVISRTTIQTTQLHGLRERGKKQQPSGDFGDVAQIKNCWGVTLLRINNSVCAYNYHRRKKAELEIFPPQAHLGKHHAVKTTANSPWRWLVHHLCGTWAEGGLPLAENAEEQDGGACCWQDGHAAKSKSDLYQRTVNSAQLCLCCAVVNMCCVSAFLIVAFQILYMMYVGSSRNKGP